ncbi:MAG: TonB-dependent receptor [Polyangiaceae bacterium]|nr:TonB-dependent receptor [Polyangiaceae bacterium]
MARFGLAAVFSATLALAASASFAAPVTLPKPLAPIVAEAPNGTEGEADVKLEVVVGIDGRVHSINVLEGSPPFSNAAMSAVSNALFEPARRGDEAIVARFVLLVHVKKNGSGSAPTGSKTPSEQGGGATSPAQASAAPAATPTLSPATAPGASTGSAPPGGVDAKSALPTATPKTIETPRAPPTPIDVNVDGVRGPTAAPEPAGEHWSARAVSRIPGAFGDAFRAVEIAPGVVPYASGLPYFFVRGATPTSTGYFLDGVPVPLLFHVGVGPGVIAPQVLGSLDFYPGGYPAMYGRQVGGVLSAQTQAPVERFSAEITARALDVGVYATAPLPFDRGSAFAAARFSITQAIVPLIANDLNLGYWDYQVGARLKINAQDSVRVFAFGADDFLTQTEFGEEKPLYKGQFHRVDVAFEHGERRAQRPFMGSIFGNEVSADAATEALRTPRVYARVAASGGHDRTTISGQGDLLSTMVQMRSLFDAQLHRAVRLRAGTDLLAETRRLERVPFSEISSDDDGSFADAFRASTVGSLAAFTDISLRPFAGVDLTLGLRGEMFGDPKGAVGAADPRFSATLTLLPWLSAVTTFGTAHQRPSFLVPLPGAVPTGETLVLQSALQASQAVEVVFPWRTKLRMTGYLHEYEQLSDFLATCGPGETECDLDERAKGRSIGLELLLSRELTEKLGGQIAYTLSRTERTANDTTFTADTDRTHVIHVIVGYEPAPGWHAGVRATAYSGRPFSLVAYDDRYDRDRQTLVGKRNVPRGPGFFRLDLRVSKTWRIGKTGFVTAVLEGLNVTLAKETVVVDCRTPIDALDSCGAQEVGPISIPSLGVTAGF